MSDIIKLKERARIVKAIRDFFDKLGFTEVETAVRIPAPAPEEHIDCPPCKDGGFLRASPELQMKKLLAEGMDKIYQIGPCFREGELGSRHNPEFTMIEWYRKDASYLDIKEDLKQLFLHLSLNTYPLSFRELTVREAYLKFAQWDPWESFDQDRFDFDMATKIEPALKEMGDPVFLMDYPPECASLARLSTRHSALGTYDVAERWEFYYDGMELANCFSELCDEAEQRRRFAKAKENRRALGESDYPLDEAFFKCLPEMGMASGVALGVDRLIVVLTGAKTIQEVRADV
ncbi:MAG: EF-P lysine aminoacylase GenX [Kiritimatiellae bacterium]|nr:EF-P lysine aminoacylase GenX [Kiritimatiellia bacterium]